MAGALNLQTLKDQVVRNSFTNSFAWVANLFINLAAIPLLLRHLGIEGYAAPRLAGNRGIAGTRRQDRAAAHADALGGRRCGAAAYARLDRDYGAPGGLSTDTVSGDRATSRRWYERSKHILTDLRASGNLDANGADLLEGVEKELAPQR